MDEEVLTGGGALGDRFVALLGAPREPGWLPAAELFGAGLPALLHAAGAARGTDNPAVAAVLAFEQYVLRLVAPVLAALYRDGAVLDANLPGVRAHVADGAVRRLAFAARPAAAVTEARAEVTDRLIAGNLTTVVDALHEHTRIGRRVLWGSAANAIANTLLHLSWPARPRDRYVPAAREFLAGVPGLAALVTVESVHTSGEAWMYTDRNTCCLAFRTSVNEARAEPYCGTCPVLGERTRALFAEAAAAYLARHQDR